jgi:hypothetical protein
MAMRKYWVGYLTLLLLPFISFAAEPQLKQGSVTKQLDCKLESDFEENIRKSFTANESSSGTFSDGYLPFEEVRKKIWINRERQIALQLSMFALKKNQRFEIVLKNLCNPSLMEARGSVEIDLKKNPDDSPTVYEIFPLIIKGDLISEKFQDKEILAYLRYTPSKKIVLSNSVVFQTPEDFHVAFFTKSQESSAEFKIQDYFRVFALKELEK